MKQTTEKIDPVCLIHGKKMSEHHCLYCCLCFKSLTIDECNINEMGAREDVCRQCAQEERIALLQSQKERLVEALEGIIAAWNRHGGRIIESRGGLEDNRVSEVNGAIEGGEQVLTEIQKAK